MAINVRGTAQPAARLYSMKLMLALWSLVALLLLASQWLTSLPDPWVLALAVMLALPMAVLLFWRRRLQRWAWRRAVMNPASRYYTSFRGAALMFGVQAGLALALSGVLLVGLARQESTLFWLALVGMVPLWVQTHRWLEHWLRGHLDAGFARLAAHRLQAMGYGAALLALLFAWSMFQSVDDLQGVSIETAVLAFTADIDANSTSLQASLEVIAAFDALRHWLAQNLAHAVPGLLLGLLTWALVLLREWLLVWPLLLLWQAVHVLVEGGLWEQVRQAGSVPPSAG
jgi:hypothetical protein